jgi:hypothetical protein
MVLTIGGQVALLLRGLEKGAGQLRHSLSGTKSNELSSRSTVKPLMRAPFLMVSIPHRGLLAAINSSILRVPRHPGDIRFAID